MATSTFVITAASFSSPNTTYTYSTVVGTATGGFRPVIGATITITGMAHAGNNKSNATITAVNSGTGTFTINNTSGVTATESGTATQTFTFQVVSIPTSPAQCPTFGNGWPINSTPLVAGYWPPVPKYGSARVLPYAPGQIFPTGGQSPIAGQIFP